MADENKTQPAQPMALVPWEPQNATDAWTLAKYYGQSNLVPKALANVADIFVTIAAGRDFGWSAMQSMRGIHVVEGKPSLSADAMVALAKRHPLCEYFRLVKSDEQIATYETKRKGDPDPVRMSFTAAEAEAAGLLGKKGPWQSYRPRMLRNRAKSILCKEVYEDLFFGTYEEDEAREIIELNGAPAARVAPRAAPVATSGAPRPPVPAPAPSASVVVVDAKPASIAAEPINNQAVEDAEFTDAPPPLPFDGKLAADAPANDASPAESGPGPTGDEDVVATAIDECQSIEGAAKAIASAMALVDSDTKTQLLREGVIKLIGYAKTPADLDTVVATMKPLPESVRQHKPVREAYGNAAKIARSMKGAA